MHGVSVRATAETGQVETVGDVRPLNSFEWASGRRRRLPELLHQSRDRHRLKAEVQHDAPARRRSSR